MLNTLRAKFSPQYDEEELLRRAMGHLYLNKRHESSSKGGFGAITSQR